MATAPILKVSPKAVKSIARRHPWIFSKAVEKPSTGIPAGETVALQSTDGQWLAWGAFSPRSQIRVRIWSFDADETIDDAFFHRRLAAAVQARQQLPLVSPCTAQRLVNAESDGLPGLIVDQYGEYLVCQFLAAGAEHWKTTITAHLHRLLPVRGIFERSDADVRGKEGLPLQSGVLWGAAPPGLVKIQLGGIHMLVDVVNGHKTGCYLDQRENQARIGDFASGAQVLNCFSYTGAFGLWALKAGAAHVTNIDASAAVMDLARQNLVANGWKTQQTDLVVGNVFQELRRYCHDRRQFDLIVLDPPKFVSAKGQLPKGCRGYKDINRLAFELLLPGGVLFTFSCSGLVTPQLFQKIVADAAVDAQRHIRLIVRLDQAADHPVALPFPEGHYLKGFICMAD